MKTGIISSPSIASDGLQSSVMGMSEKGMDIAAYFLRDKIYNDKVLACIREYTCNAVDEHRKYNIQTPVKISIDKKDEEVTWSVRDFAKGLNEQSIRSIFGMYFESTKNSNNDSIGGFGIGSKAGHAYCDTFYVDSYHDGTHTLYACILGGGDKGVPVGEIYKMNESPTSESGIKISIPVKNVSEFITKTKGFVQRFDADTPIIFYDNVSFTKNTTIPQKHVKRVDLGDGIFITQYSDTSEFSTKIFKKYNSGYDNAAIRMGGVVYNISHNLISNTNFKLPTVIDVPIGLLSIPISREHIEDTEKNRRILSNINNMILNYKNDLSSNFKPESFGDYIEKYIYNTGHVSSNFENEWFIYKMTDVIPDVFEALRKIRFVACFNKNGQGIIPDKINNKHIIYKIPLTKSKNQWPIRLENYLKDIHGADKFSHYYTVGDSLEEIIANSNPNCLIKEGFAIIDVKKMNLPKLVTSKSERKFAFYKYDSRKGIFNADECTNFVKKHHSVDFDLSKNWWESVNSLFELNYFTIYTKEQRYSRAFCNDAIYNCNSKQLVTELLNNGWLSPDSDEYKNAKERIQKKEREENERANVEYNLKHNFIKTNFNNRTVEILKKNPSSIQRLKNVKQRIIAENSVRSRLLRHFVNISIDRNDLRFILNSGKLQDKA